jgi:hypothetical protein
VALRSRLVDFETTPTSQAANADLPEGPGVVFAKWVAIVDFQDGNALNLCNTCKYYRIFT